MQDEWGDTFIAFTRAMEELMWQANAVRNGWAAQGVADGFDVTQAAKDNLDAFSEALLDLVQRSDAADFCPCLDSDGDQFLDPDGVNASEDDDGDWKSRHPQRMPDAPPPLRKAGRAISGANRQIITDALDGMSEAMKTLKAHHGAIADLMDKTDPDHARQDEDTVLGDDDTANGGTNPNKSRFAHRTAPERPQADATLAALDADLSALKSRMQPGRKA